MKRQTLAWLSKLTAGLSRSRPLPPIPKRRFDFPRFVKKFWSEQRKTNEVKPRPTFRPHFPIQYPLLLSEAERVRDHTELIDTIPWGMIEQHEPQALKNHKRTIEQLAAQQCGLKACEAVAVLEDRPWRRMRIVEAYYRLGQLVRAYEPAPPMAPDSLWFENPDAIRQAGGERGLGTRKEGAR